MTLKTLTLSTAIAALFAGAAFAESHTTATDDASGQTEMTTEDGMAADTMADEPMDDTMDTEPMDDTAAEGTDLDTGLEDLGMDAQVGDADMAAEPMEPLAYESLETLTIDQFLGLVVHAPDEARIGEIDYVVMNGEQPMGVIGIGGFLGLGEYTVAIPLSEFDLGPDGDRLILAADKKTLKQVPEFDETGVEGLSGDTPLSSLMTDA